MLLKSHVDLLSGVWTGDGELVLPTSLSRWPWGHGQGAWLRFAAFKGLAWPLPPFLKALEFRLPPVKMGFMCWLSWSPFTVTWEDGRWGGPDCGTLSLRVL